MVKRYGELYLEARRALRASEGENASFVARELLGFASGKSAAALMADKKGNIDELRRILSELLSIERSDNVQEAEHLLEQVNVIRK